MKGLKRLSTPCLCCLLFLTAARSAPADFLGVVATVRSDLTICQDTSQDFIDEPLTVCNFFAVFDDPTDRLLSTGNANITTTDPAGFFQHPFNPSIKSPSCVFIPLIPTLACDSFITIGLSCDDGFDNTQTDADWNSTWFNSEGRIEGGWGATPQADGTSPGDAGAYPDNLVLFLQLAMRQGQSVSGEIDLFWRDNTGEFIGEFDLILECPGPCPADFNGDGRVGSFDLAQLLGDWGPCAGCPADLNDDGIVGAFDLALLLGAWGACP